MICINVVTRTRTLFSHPKNARRLDNPTGSLLLGPFSFSPFHHYPNQTPWLYRTLIFNSVPFDFIFIFNSQPTNIQYSPPAPTCLPQAKTTTLSPVICPHSNCTLIPEETQINGTFVGSMLKTRPPAQDPVQ